MSSKEIKKALEESGLKFRMAQGDAGEESSTIPGICIFGCYDTGCASGICSGGWCYNHGCLVANCQNNTCFAQECISGCYLGRCLIGCYSESQRT